MTHPDAARWGLAADIGGTKTWLALVALEGAKAGQLYEPQKFSNSDFASLDAMLTAYLDQPACKDIKLTRMVLACAGPVREQACTLTNVAWHLDARQLQRQFDSDQVLLLNDFYAAAKGISLIPDDQMLKINAAVTGEPGIALVTGAGTGLGLAWLDHATQGFAAHATEGGHALCAAQNAEQQAFLSWFVQGAKRTACWEDVLSGPGLERLYNFCAGGKATEPCLSAAEIVSAAQQQNAIALMTIRLFWRFCAGWVADLTLLFRPTIIYLAGGVVQHLAPWLDANDFCATMVARSTMLQQIDAVPVVLVKDEQLGLLGAQQVLQDCVLEENG